MPSSVPHGSVLGLLLFSIFLNNLCNDIKSKIKLFADYAKLLFWSLSKEMTQMDLNELSDQEDIWNSNLI